MKTFSKEIREAMKNAYSGHCARCYKMATGFHHRLANTKYNQNRYPIFLQSVFNAVPLCEDCHINHKHDFDIPERLVVIYEKYLRGEIK